MDNVGIFTGHCFNVVENVLSWARLASPGDANPACVSTASNGVFHLQRLHLSAQSPGDHHIQCPDGSLSATGCQTYMAIPISSVAWLTRVFDAAGAAIPTGFPNLGPFTLDGVSLGYKALDMAFTTVTDTACQTFSFRPQLAVTLHFPQSLTYQVEDAAGTLIGGPATGMSATIAAGNQVVLTTPHELTGSLQVIPSISVASDTFSNTMTDRVAESAHLTIGVLNFSFPDNVLGFTGFDAGPIYDHTYPLADSSRTVFNMLLPWADSINRRSVPYFSLLIPALCPRRSRSGRSKGPRSDWASWRTSAIRTPPRVLPSTAA